MKTAELRIVFVEDIPADAAMVEAALRRDGLDFSLMRIETKEDFLRELNVCPPDVILSDHGLPTFDGLTALNIAHKQCPDVPFIFVTNALSREMEIEKLTPGVTDYVQKRHISALGPVIRRAVQTAEQRRLMPMTPMERQRIVSKLLALLAEYGAEDLYLPICANCKKIRDKQNRWNPPEVFFRDHLGLEFTHGICPDCNETLYGTDPR